MAVDAPDIGNPDLVRVSSNGSGIDSNADDLRLPDVVVARIVDPSPTLALTSPSSVLPTSGPPAVDPDMESQEDDSDEDDVPYWARLKEDHSQPDDRELKAIEKKSNEVNALDRASLPLPQPETFS